MHDVLIRVLYTAAEDLRIETSCTSTEYIPAVICSNNSFLINDSYYAEMNLYCINISLILHPLDLHSWCLTSVVEKVCEYDYQWRSIFNF